MTIRTGRIRGRPLKLAGEGNDTRPGQPAGKIHPVDPAAVAVFKAYLQQNGENGRSQPKRSNPMPRPRKKPAPAVPTAAPGPAMPDVPGLLEFAPNVPLPITATYRSKYAALWEHAAAQPPNQWHAYSFDQPRTASNAAQALKKMAKKRGLSSLHTQAAATAAGSTLYIKFQSTKGGEKS